MIISSFSLVLWKTGAAGASQLCILVIERGLPNARDLQGKGHVIFYLYSAVSTSTASVIVDTLEFGKRWIPSSLLLCTKRSCCPVFYPPAIAGCSWTVKHILEKRWKWRPTLFLYCHKPKLTEKYYFIFFFDFIFRNASKSTFDLIRSLIS